MLSHSASRLTAEAGLTCGLNVSLCMTHSWADQIFINLSNNCRFVSPSLALVTRCIYSVFCWKVFHQKGHICPSARVRLCLVSVLPESLNNTWSFVIQSKQRTDCPPSFSLKQTRGHFKQCKPALTYLRSQTTHFRSTTHVCMFMCM